MSSMKIISSILVACLALGMAVAQNIPTSINGMINKAEANMPKIPSIRGNIPNMPNVDLPNMPNINMPSVDLPNMPNLPSLPNMPSLPSLSLPSMPRIPSMQGMMNDVMGAVNRMLG